MFINEDEDLQCLICGKRLVRRVEFEYDTREGKIRDNKKKKSWSNVDSNSKVVIRRTRSRSTSDNDSTLVRQRGLGGTGRGLASRG